MPIAQKSEELGTKHHAARERVRCPSLLKKRPTLISILKIEWWRPWLTLWIEEGFERMMKTSALTQLLDLQEDGELWSPAIVMVK